MQKNSTTDQTYKKKNVISYLEKTRVGRAYVVSQGKSNETSTIVTDSDKTRPGGTPRQHWVDR